jgi:hypothetical protein
MVMLASSMFDLTGMSANAGAVGDVLFLAIGGVVAALLVYGLAKQQRRL